ncbi:MAG: DUF1800 domain-containing protein [Planctomycetes bacterium]|nr:DUF1800 domain-containing protein [Planctomycetota bacterium]
MWCVQGVLVASAALAPASGPGGTAVAPAPIARWDARLAEHLLNRAGFGGDPAEVARLAALGREAAVASFFPDPRLTPSPHVLPGASLPGGLEDPAGRHEFVTRRRENFTGHQIEIIVALNKYGDWWLERMIRGEDPLRDHMTIFWHGHFATSIKEVGNSQEMIEQVRFLRANALESFRTLAHGIGKTPAMLEYLDNAENVKAHPNENWARELLELFSLGDGNYTEKDIKEAARAFTGWTDRESRFVFDRLVHDFGQKSFLGVTGQLDGDQCVDVVLEQPACARFIAGKLLHYFEGQEPDPERVEDYARFLREQDYAVGALLRRLFLDDAFYRDEILGARVQGPVEFLVGTCRRLGFEVPGQVLLNGADMLGQRLFWPPSVKGWEGGMSWITTATLMNRSNVTGAMLGLVEMTSLVVDEEFEPGLLTMTDSGRRRTDRVSRTNGLNHIRTIQERGWTPHIDLVALVRAAGARSDREIARVLMDRVLAVPLEEPMVAEPAAWLGREREARGVPAEGLLDSPEAEDLLRRFAHLVLSLPEAQLH